MELWIGGILLAMFWLYHFLEDVKERNKVRAKKEAELREKREREEAAEKIRVDGIRREFAPLRAEERVRFSFAYRVE